MTTASPPRARRRFTLALWPTVIAGLILLGLAAVLLRGSLFRRADPLDARQTALVERESVIDQVAATGAIEPRVTSKLAFPSTGGRVERVLVAENDAVEANQPLIMLSTRRLAANVASAEAVLAQAQADRTALREGATPEQIAVSQAQVEAARGALAQTEGSVTAADLRAAQARVAEARALLARLEAGPKATDAQAADAQFQQAQVAVQQQRNSLSAAKTNAELALTQSADALVQAQSSYATAKSNWEYVQETGNDPQNPRRADSQGRSVANSVNDAQRQQYYDTFVKAEAAMRSAETGVRQAEVALENARQAEITGIRAAEEQARAAQANAEGIRAGADLDALEAARAQLTGAQAELVRLQGLQRAGALQAQRASLAGAQAQLAELLADPKASDLARAEASVAQAEAQLELARAELDEATLRAPFAGVVGTINVAPGEIVGQDALLTLLDTSRYSVKLQVDEVDVARVAVGQPVEVLIDALGAPALAGTVRRITPQAQQANNVTAYEVAVEVDAGERPVRQGMTANASIIAARADGVLSVPAEAVRDEQGRTLVDVVTTAQNGERSVASKPVEIGLRAGGRVEIRSGLSEGEEVLLP